MKKVNLLVIFTLFSLNVFTQSPGFITDSLESYIREGMKDWQVPGLSIVIIKDGKVVLMKGYGICDLAAMKPVDTNTLFMIGSDTKLFTGTALAKLEFDKKISLDDRIVTYLPWFKLYDSVTTQLTTIRDLLSHRIGTKTFQGDFTFWNSNLSRDEIIRKMQLLKPSGIFRQDYGYCNSCVLTAGQVIEVSTGKKWEDYISDSILTPLKMSNTYTRMKGIEQRDNVARPYTTSYTGKLRKVPYDQCDNLGPATGMISNVADLSHWLLFQLDSGRYKGVQIMPFSVLQKTRDMNIVINSRQYFYKSPVHIMGYGLGTYISDYYGRETYWHNGGVSGMISSICFVPEERLGIAILTNNDNQNFASLLRYQIMDAYFGVDYANHSSQSLPGFKRDMDDQLKEVGNWRRRLKDSLPPLPIQSYTGHYTNPVFGSMDIIAKDRRLLLKFNGHDGLTAVMDYMDNGEWLLQYNNIEYGIFSTRFSLNPDKVMSVEIKAIDDLDYEPYVFSKK